MYGFSLSRICQCSSWGYSFQLQPNGSHSALQKGHPLLKVVALPMSCKYLHGGSATHRLLLQVYSNTAYQLSYVHPTACKWIYIKLDLIKVDADSLCRHKITRPCGQSAAEQHTTMASWAIILCSAGTFKKSYYLHRAS